ncbi:unnamed protein product [Phytophthora fragariaefolia]|uniref:Unnamed protein product n=1 Tax=Phytophthora fragariaefolia TaxID=1490495 RepID=A0A9W7CQD9_9STRA|nr:unnamed protein product [Phytophthora fragariaefolia]
MHKSWSMASGGSASESDKEPTEDQSPEVHVPAPRAGLVRAPRMMEGVFENWDAFFAHRHVYQQDTHQIYKKRTSTSSAARNADLEQRGKATPQTVIPGSFDKYYRKLVCTYSWTRASRSKGKQNNYFVKSTGCEAAMTVTVVWDATRGFHVKITQQQTEHNHALASGGYGNHPSKRVVEDEAMIDFVDELQAAGAKKKLILQFLRRRTDTLFGLISY